jgi:vitamin B12 transporter
MNPTLFCFLAHHAFAVRFVFLLLQVRGVVYDPSGRPVPDAQVVCGTETKATDSQGAFEVASPCEATITKPGFAPAKASLPTENRITLELATASENVVVTAEAAPVAIEEAGVAATVFTASDFEPPHAPFVQDLLRDVPGVDVAQTGQNGALTSVFLRGADSTSALVLLDGVPVTDPGGSIDFVHLTSAGLDRMEVIRGPESALFGAEGASGVIQMFTLHGDAESATPHGQFIYDRGSFSSDHWSGLIDGGLAHRFDYAFTVDQFRSTGEFPNDAYRITTGTANLGYRFSDSTKIRATYREFDAYTGDPGETADQAIEPLDLLSYSTDRDTTLSVRVDDTRNSSFSEQILFGYHRYRDAYYDGYDPASITLADRDIASYQGTWTQRAGALVFGDEFQRQAGLISGEDRSRYNDGVFVYEQYRLGRRIFLSGGARVEHSTVFGTAFTPRGAVTFLLPRQTYFRLSAAHGEQEPSLLENFAREAYFVGNPNLQPEKTNSYEAGLEREFLSGRVRAEASFFRNSFHDLIEYNSFVYPGTWDNIEAAWARGFELSSTVRVKRYLAVRGSYTKLYTDTTESNDESFQIGQPLLRRPRNSGAISLQLTPRRFTFVVGARLVGQRPDSDYLQPNILTSPAYQYLYIGASWQVQQHVTPFFRMGNALNESYQEAQGYAALSRTATGGLKIGF